MQPAGEAAADYGQHLLRRVQRADVVPAGCLGDVAMQVLEAEVVKHSHIAALENRPKALNAVRMCHPSHIAVLHALMRSVQAVCRKVPHRL